MNNLINKAKETNLSCRRIANNTGTELPLRRVEHTPHSSAQGLTTFQRVQYGREEWGRGRRKFTMEKPDKHCLSQVVKTSIKS